MADAAARALLCTAPRCGRAPVGRRRLRALRYGRVRCGHHLRPAPEGGSGGAAPEGGGGHAALRPAYRGDDRIADRPPPTPADPERQQTSPLAGLVRVERDRRALDIARFALRPQFSGDRGGGGRLGRGSRINPSGRARDFAGTPRRSAGGAVAGHPLCRPPPRLSAPLRAAGAAPRASPPGPPRGGAPTPPPFPPPPCLK